MEQAGPAISEDDHRVYEEHVADEGFYVRLRGHYGREKDVVIVYTAFSYANSGQFLLVYFLIIMTIVSYIRYTR